MIFMKQTQSCIWLVARRACRALVIWTLGRTLVDPGLAAGVRVLGPRTESAATVNVAIKESFDSNVYLQDMEPGLPGAFPAKKESFVTTITPRLTVSYPASTMFQIAGSYAPDIVFYHSAHSEDHVAHRFGLTFNGAAEKLAWEQANSFVWTDGSGRGPLFAAPQDVPAVGGIPLRDRRDALMYRGSLKAGWKFDEFLIRPVASAYVHDFRTQQKLPADTAPYTYVNYNDRRDINAGMDLGWAVRENLWLLVGYRFGMQDQLRGVSVFDPTRFANSPYDSEYHRLLVGLEGAPVPWLKLNVLLGPDIRSWRHTTPNAFDRNEIVYWVDASATITPTKNDTVTLLSRRFEQPAFTSQSVYEDITYSVSWRHKFSPEVSATLGFQLYIGDWQAPVNREDWIYTPSASLVWVYDRRWTIELGYSYDWVENKVPTTVAPLAEGREYTRHIASITLRYTF